MYYQRTHTRILNRLSGFPIVDGLIKSRTKSLQIAPVVLCKADDLPHANVETVKAMYVNSVKAMLTSSQNRMQRRMYSTTHMKNFGHNEYASAEIKVEY